MELQTTGRLKEIEVEVKFLGEQTARNFIKMGSLLSEAKKKFFSENKSGWQKWLDENVIFLNHRTAQRMVTVYERFGTIGPMFEKDAMRKMYILASLDDEKVKEVLTEDHLIGDEIKKATELSREELRQVVNEKKQLQEALANKDKVLDNMQRELAETKRRSSEEIIQAIEKEKELQKRNAMRLLEQWKDENEHKLKEQHNDLLIKQKKLLETNKNLEAELQEIRLDKAEWEGKENRQLLLEQQLLQTTQDISKLSTDKEQVLKDITYLKDLGKFYEQTKDYVSALVNVAHNPCYIKYFGEKDVSENFKEIIGVAMDNLGHLKSLLISNKNYVEAQYKEE